MTVEHSIMSQIAKSAVVDKSAQLGEGVVVGPGCVVEQGVVIGDGSVLKANVIVCAGTRMGSNNRIFSNCVLGDEPQILGSHQPDTQLIIGNDNTFRENVIINRGSPDGAGKTVIGNDNYFMIGAHLGHDCEIEHNVVLGNYTQIGGHNKIERNVWFSAFIGTHQFVTVGRFTYVAGQAGLASDQPPFMRVSGSYPCRVRGLNVIGLTRAGLDRESIAALKKAYRFLYRSRDGKSLAKAVEQLQSQDNADENVSYLLQSLQRSNEHRMGRYRELFR